MPTNTLEETIVAALKADATIAAEVGSEVYLVPAPPTATLPVITVERTADEEHGNLDGSDTYHRVTFGVTAYATDYAQALRLGAACLGVMNNLAEFDKVLGGYATSSSVEPVEIEGREQVAYKVEITAFVISNPGKVL